MSAADVGAPGVSAPGAVLTCGELGWEPLRQLLGRFGLELHRVAPQADIPGSYWGAPEAGLRGHGVHARDDTPVHSLLHEACHAVCMDAARRAQLDTDAGGADAEENGVCYLQIVLADRLPGVGSSRLLADMDRWGYSFRLGSARRWFEEDAEDARAWLVEHGLLDAGGEPTWRTR